MATIIIIILIVTTHHIVTRVLVDVWKKKLLKKRYGYLALGYPPHIFQKDMLSIAHVLLLYLVVTMTIIDPYIISLSVHRKVEKKLGVKIAL
jgi:hypothetical protein